MNDLTPYGLNQLPDYILDALIRIGFEHRYYQELAVIKSLKLLQNGKNVEITLPPGTGKTLISQVIACIWLNQINNQSKVIYILPSKVLAEQHYNFCQYWAGAIDLCSICLVSSEWLSRKNIRHGAFLRSSNLWFTLPEVFSNNVGSKIPYSYINLIDLVIIDEYDTFSIGVLRSFGYTQKFTKPLEKLFSVLDWRERSYLLLSATPVE